MKLSELSDKQEEHLMFEMANLYPQKTGLSVVMYFGEVGGQHGPRLKVSNTPGKFNTSDNFVVSVSENPEVKAGKEKISQAALSQIFEWVKLNYTELMELWKIHETGDGDVDSVLAKLKKV
jgi:hypothetical protein